MFHLLCFFDLISKRILLCIDDCLCSKHDDKGGSSHIQSQRQQWQLCGGLIFNDANASNWKHSPCFLSPFFCIYTYCLLGRNVELSSCNNHLALVIMSSCKLFQAVSHWEVGNCTPEPIFEKHINGKKPCLLIFLGHQDMQHVFDTSCVDRVMHWMAYSYMVLKIFCPICLLPYLCVFFTIGPWLLHMLYGRG